MIFPFAVRVSEEEARAFAQRALKEDVGRVDITSAATVEPGANGKALVRLEEPGVIAGLAVFRSVFQVQDSRIKVTARVREGRWCEGGIVLAEIRGKVRSILTCERVALNFLQHLSGIATVTRRFVEEVKGTTAKIIDTRKTTPGLRLLEKYAVLMGGGYNHRLTLSHLALIKDNHITAAGGMRQAVARVRKSARDVPVEIEVGPHADLDQMKDLDVDIIMLDNWPVAKLKKAIQTVRRFRSSPLVEVSGRVKLSNVRKIARCGPDFISIGYLTHSAPALDISLDLQSRMKA